MTSPLLLPVSQENYEQGSTSERRHRGDPYGGRVGPGTPRYLQARPIPPWFCLLTVKNSPDTFYVNYAFLGIGTREIKLGARGVWGLAADRGS